ncbi:uncharacterized protein LOC142320624 [Lycorma delicatula]|uniref:uncharacterized protein LOC142320624 n=1 Tax=Lycorma delicatula TaxID=130591 RepID=UPI003F5185E9
MGQRFSDLRGSGNMEEKGINEINISVSSRNDFSTNSAGNTISVGLSDQRTGFGVNDNNGNNDIAISLNEHFENIYSNNSDPLRSVEDNGNVPDVQNKLDGNVATTSCDVSKSLEEEACKNSKGNKSNSGHKRSHKALRSVKEMSGNNGGKKKRNHWVLRFNCARLKSGSGSSGTGSETDIPEANISCDSCVCTGYRRTEDHHLGAGVVFEASTSAQTSRQNDSVLNSDSGSDEDIIRTHPVIDLSKFNPDDYPIEDCDERARLERAREIEEGVEPPPGFRPGQHIQLVCPPEITIDNLTLLFHSAALSALSQLDTQRVVHTQVDYIHCLVPDLLQITSCSFYWGKMDRYEAERLLEGRPEGTFLLRDSAQEEYLFSVSFRKYGRSLHARIEQWNHRFSFDSHDPGVFSSSTVCGLIEHYKDPSCCMFFEPMLTIPLHRNFPFPLQHLCRAVVCSRATYDGVSQLKLPKALKAYLKEYHYKQRVRVKRFDTEQ